MKFVRGDSFKCVTCGAWKSYLGLGKLPEPGPPEVCHTGLLAELLLLLSHPGGPSPRNQEQVQEQEQERSPATGPLAEGHPPEVSWPRTMTDA